MKFLLPIFIIFTIAIRPILPLVNYAVNFDSIVKNECVNRAKPQQNCKGKCFLEKELAKTEKQSKQITSKSNSIDVFVTNDILDCNPNSSNIFEEYSNFFEYKNLQLSFFSAEIFHPPLV